MARIIAVLLIAALTPSFGAEPHCSTALQLRAPRNWKQYLEPLRKFVMASRQTMSDVRTVRLGDTGYPVLSFLGRSCEGGVFEVADETAESGRSSIKQYFVPPNKELSRDSYMRWSHGRLGVVKTAGMPTIMMDRPELDWENLTAKFKFVYGMSVEDATEPKFWNGSAYERVPAELRLPEHIRTQILDEYNWFKIIYCNSRYNPSHFNSGDNGRFSCNKSDILIEFDTERMIVVDE